MAGAAEVDEHLEKNSETDAYVALTGPYTPSDVDAGDDNVDDLTLTLSKETTRTRSSSARLTI